jgi:methionine-rich copper-binding protein CopC
MITTRYRSIRLAVPAWFIILAALLTASVIVERAKATVPLPEAGEMTHHPRTSRLTNGRAIAFALSFDQIVSHSGSQLTLISSTGSTRNIPIRLVAQPNTLYASVGGLEPGEYQLQWDALAADGRRLHGSLPFRVGSDV